MIKNILKFFTIYFGITLVFLIYAVYRDIRINKLFNYSSKPENISFRTSVIKDGITSIEYDLNFESRDNFLGAVYIPVRNIGGADGTVVFRIKDLQSGKLLHENRFDYNYFKNLSTYIFGFPVIADSNNKEFQISLTFTSNNQQQNSILTSDAANQIQAKYVFPRETIIKTPGKIIDILRNRVVSSAKELDYLKYFSYILIASLVVLLVSNSDLFKKYLSKIGGLENIAAKIIDPKFSFLFFIPAFSAILLIPVLIFLNSMTLAEKMAEYIWILLFFGFIWYFATSIFFLYFPKLLKIKSILKPFVSFFNREHLKIYLFSLSLFLILLSGLKNTYYLGGDDTRLFYLYPQEFLLNFASKIVSDTAMSGVAAMAPPVTASLALVMVVLKKIVGSLNLQSMLYTANLIGGFVAFFILIRWIIPLKHRYSNLINTISSFIYIFSVFNIYTLYNSRLVAIFLVSMFPLFVYLFLRSVKERKPVFLFVLAVISSVLSFFVLAAPWFLAAMITLMPVLIYSLWNYKTRTLKYLAILALIMLVLNFNWIVYLPNSSVLNQSQGIISNSVTSLNYRKENEKGIRTVSEMNSVFYPIMNTYHRNIVENFGWSYLPILTTWSLKILPLNIIYFAVFLIAGIFLKKKDRVKGIYISGLFSLLLSIYFFTVNLTSWGPDLFVWLNNNIPGFVIFRNMYDKFAFSLSFSFALTLAISLHILISNIKIKKNIAYLFILLVILVIVDAKPLLLGEYNRTPVWTTRDTFDSIKAFNEDFVNLVNYVKNTQDLGRYLVLPLSTGNAFPIQDISQANHYYNGVSPLLVLTGKNDLSGLLSFGEIGDRIFTLLKDKEYDQLGSILQKFNVKYIIVNHTINDDLKNSFVYSEGLYYLQNEDMLSKLVGNKIEDFGQRYSLYQINEKFENEKIYLTGNIEEIPNSNNDNIIFKKINSHLYDIDIKDTKNGGNLIFLDPYLEGWKLVSDNGVDFLNDHFVSLGYANGWKLNSFNDQRSNLNLKLYYKPYDYFWFSSIISIAGYLVSILIIFKSVIKK